MKKHVLFIVENNAVPLDPRVWREALAVKSWGHDVSVICCKKNSAKKSYENLEGIDIYRHPTAESSIQNWGHILEYANALFWELLLSIKVFLRKPFQVIHAANPPDLIFLIALVFKLFGVKYVFDVHDLSPELYKAAYEKKNQFLYKALVLFEKLSCRVADVIITTNKSYAEIVEKRHKVNPSCVFIVRNDPIINEFGHGTYKIPDIYNGKRVILYLGAINRQDGVDNLVSSLNYLINNLNEKNIYCIIVGEGNGVPFVMNKIEELGLENYFYFTGFIYDRNKLNEYMEIADVCVEPAPGYEINNISTFIKILEYMSAGKPIVAFDLKETRYSTGGSAMLIPPGDIEGFAKAIKTLLNDTELGEELGRSGRNRIRNQLNWRNSVSNLKVAYDFIIC